jgi:CRISPR system Cascade subunit CasD
MRMDFHTAGGTHRAGDTYGVAKADGSRPGAVTSRRYYLADAEFVVGLEGADLDLLRRLDAALANPKWQLFLGRKSFVPSTPVRPPEEPPWGPALREQTLEEALRRYPWLGDLRRRSYESRPQQLLTVIDDAKEISGDVRRDLPLSFSERRFAIRYVKTQPIQTPPKEAL